MPQNKGHYVDTKNDNPRRANYDYPIPAINISANEPIKKNKISAKLASGHRPNRRSINT